MKKNAIIRNNAIIIMAVITVIALPLRAWLVGRYAARDYGRYVSSAFGSLGFGGFSQTDELRMFFNEPDLVACENRAKRSSILIGGGYVREIEALKTGMIYLSEQASLPEEKRLASPPRLEGLGIDASDRSDNGLARAAGKLILEYREEH